MVSIVGRDESVVKHCSCRSCAAKLEYVPREVVLLWSGTDYGGGSDGAEGFKCPSCGGDVIIRRW